MPNILCYQKLVDSEAQQTKEEDGFCSFAALISSDPESFVEHLLLIVFEWITSGDNYIGITLVDDEGTGVRTQGVIERDYHHGVAVRALLH